MEKRFSVDAATSRKVRCYGCGLIIPRGHVRLTLKAVEYHMSPIFYWCKMCGIQNLIEERNRYNGYIQQLIDTLKIDGGLYERGLDANSKQVDNHANTN